MAVFKQTLRQWPQLHSDYRKKPRSREWKPASIPDALAQPLLRRAMMLSAPRIQLALSLAAASNSDSVIWSGILSPPDRLCLVKEKIGGRQLGADHWNCLLRGPSPPTDGRTDADATSELSTSARPSVRRPVQ